MPGVTRHVVVGAGAIGGLVAARLAQAGQDVSVVARGAHGEAIRADGLVVRTPTGESTVDLPCVAHPSELSFGATDVVIVATKSHDGAPVFDQVFAASTDPAALPVIACAQNGVDNERVAARRFDRVLGICVMCPAEHLEPGVVVAYSSPLEGLFDLGDWPLGVSSEAVDLAAALETCPFEAVARPDIMAWKYAKLRMNLGNAAEALAGPAARLSGAVAAAVDEAEAVFAAAGIDVVTAERDAERRGDRINLRPVDGARRGGGSTWQSLARGMGAVETDWLNGEIVLLGRQVGVPTPVNAALTRLVTGAARAGTAPGSLSPETLDARVLSDRSPTPQQGRNGW